MIETLPEVAQKLRKAVQKSSPSSTPSTLEKVQQAAAEIERATEETHAAGQRFGRRRVRRGLGRRQRRTPRPALPAAASTASRVEPMSTSVPPTPRGVTRVVVEKPHINVKDYLWTGTLGLVTLAGQATLVVFITFFLLASGNTFRRKMVKLAGPRLSQKKITVQALDEVHEQMQRYLFVQMATSVVVGVLSGLAFFALGLNHSLVWGILAGITNLVPYLGAVVIGVASSVIGIVQFEAIDRGLYIGAASFAIHTLVGNLLTPWWMGRASRMSAFAVFVGVLAVRLALGRVGPAARDADPDGRQVGLRPGRRAEARGRAARRLSVSPEAGRLRRPAARSRRRLLARRQTSRPSPATPTSSTAQSRPRRRRASWHGALGGAGDVGGLGERAEPGLTEALSLLLELRHQRRHRQRPRRRVGRAGKQAERRLSARGEHQRRQPGMDHQAGLHRIERGRTLVGDDANEARVHGQHQGRSVGRLAVALDPVEDAAAELAPRILDPRATLQANRRDPRAGGESKVDVDQRQAAAEIEVQRAPRLGAPCRQAPRSARTPARWRRRRRPGPGRRRPRPRR